MHGGFTTKTNCLKKPFEFKIHPFNLAVVNVGAPSCGVNAAVRSFVRHGVGKGCKVYAIYDGFEGLVKGLVSRN